MIDWILITLGFIGLLIGTITDFQKREVADWLNYGLIVTGLALRLIFSIQSGDYWFFLIAVIYVLVMWILGLLMYYTGQWGGGDSKMIMGLAALFATFSLATPRIPDFIQYLFNSNLPYNLSFLFHFLVNSLFVGGVYGIVWTIVLALRHKKPFVKNFQKKFKVLKKQIAILTALALIGGISTFFLDFAFSLLVAALSFMVFILPWLLVYTKAVEDACMIQMMKIDDLTEGEWIVEDVIVDKKKICGPKDLGVTIKQIETLRKLQKKGKITEVKVKIGIPFVPAFFIAFIITVIWGNLMLFFI